jgi:hypothetical protein
MDRVLDQWIARFEDKAAEQGADAATVYIGFEFSTRVPEATAGLLAAAIRRLAAEGES